MQGVTKQVSGWGGMIYLSGTLCELRDLCRHSYFGPRTSAGHLARRHAGGGRDASWRMHVAAVACRETADRAVHSVAPHEDTPRPLDATLACHRRRPTSTRSRPTTVSTRAWHRHNGASVRRTLTEYSHATPHALGVHHARLRGRSQRMLRPTNNTLFGGHRG
jgi:hypothetical protein